MRTFTVTRPVATGRFLHVTLDFGGGTVVVVPAAGGRTLRGEAAVRC